MPAKPKKSSKKSSKTSSKDEEKTEKNTSVEKDTASKKDSDKTTPPEPTIVIPDSSPIIDESSATEPTPDKNTSASETGVTGTSESDENDTPANQVSSDTNQPKSQDNSPPVIVPADEPVDKPVPDIVDTQEFVDEPAGSGKKLLIVFIVALIIGGGAVAGFFYFFNPYASDEPQQHDQDTSEVSETTPTPVLDDKEATPSATSEEVDLATLSVQILNGSGIPGEAGVVRELLESAGFETFDVGNADSYDYTATEVQLKQGTPPTVFETINDALTASDYTVTEDSALPEDSTYDVVIVVGTKE